MTSDQTQLMVVVTLAAALGFVITAWRYLNPARGGSDGRRRIVVTVVVGTVFFSLLALMWVACQWFAHPTTT